MTKAGALRFTGGVGAARGRSTHENSRLPEVTGGRLLAWFCMLSYAARMDWSHICAVLELAPCVLDAEGSAVSKSLKGAKMSDSSAITAQSMAESSSSSSQLAKPSCPGGVGSGGAGALRSGGGPGGWPEELQLPQVHVVWHTLSPSRMCASTGSHMTLRFRPDLHLSGYGHLPRTNLRSMVWYLWAGLFWRWLPPFGLQGGFIHGTVLPPDVPPQWRQKMVSSHLLR